MDKESRTSTGVAFVLAAYAASRLFYLISGSLLAYLVPTSSFQRATLDVPSGSMNIWSHWDGEHYVTLACVRVNINATRYQARRSRRFIHPIAWKKREILRSSP